MAQILGLDLGTNSIGWAIRDKDIENKNQILDSGVLIFPQGVGEEKGVEYSLASERTKNRATRKIYRRRKKRKADLLKVLIDNSMCPLTLDELFAWTVYKKGQVLKYPTQNDEFQEWLKINPYEAPLKSQKGSVGKCTLEKTKPRCAISHPLYEEFRLHQFLNSIKIKNKYGDNNELVFLTRFPEYYNVVKKLFFRKSKSNFKFSEISKAINKEAKN